MATYALLKFKINNSFSEWEQAFYASQPNEISACSFLLKSHKILLKISFMNKHL